MNKIYTIICLAILGSSFANSQAVEGKLLGTWSDSTLVGSSAYDNVYNEIWGVALNGKEYAIIGSTFGTHFIDVTDPKSPTPAHLIIGGSIGKDIIHRDYHDHNGFLYAVSDEGSQSTLQIMDLSFLPDSLPVVYDSKEFIRTSHNIFIDTSSSILYACNTDGNDAQFNIPLRLFDISDPYKPEPIISHIGSIDGFNIRQVHDAYVIQDTAYLNCGPDGFLIADFSNPTAPIALASLSPLDYQQSGYNHSGWLSEDRKTYFLADENWDLDIKVLDVTQMPDLPVLDTIDAGNENPFSIPHNQIVHGDYLYSSYYYDGLQVWDVSDPTDITRVLQYSTSEIEHRRNYEGAWGVYPFLPSGNILVSDMQEGLFVLEPVSNTISKNNDLADALNGQWSISPNPSSGQFKIDLLEDISYTKIELLSPSGQHLQSLSVGENIINSIPSAGTYFVKLTKDNVSSTKTLMIVH